MPGPGRRWKGGWTILPLLPGAQDGGAFNISADGVTVVGSTDDPAINRPRSCYWLPGSGPIMIDSPADASPYGSSAYAVSGDGSIIVGGAQVGWYHWTAASGLVLHDNNATFYANVISANGNRIGGANSSGIGGVRGNMCYWDFPSLTRVDIPNIPGYVGASPNGISRDGSVMVGDMWDTTPAENSHPFIWTAATGIVLIDIGSATWARAFSVSGDGLIVVGDIYGIPIVPSGNQHGSFTWTQAGGLVVIPPIDPDREQGVYGYYAISDDGSTIQSYGWWPDLDHDGGNHIALTRGTERIIPTPPYLDPTSSLADQGMYPSGISHDGNVMVGYGNNGTSFNNDSAWVFALGSVVDSELFFNPQNAFFDFGNPANRRKFVSAEGTPQWIGGHGNAPFESAAAVYLSTLVPQRPLDFTINNGFGGSFPVKEGEIDPGSPLPGCSFSEVDYVVGDAPSAGWRLSVSDDGSRTWSTLEKPRAVGVTGQYRKRLRWLKMGQFRQRSLKLESTDPVRRNIKGIYIDTDQGMK